MAASQPRYHLFISVWPGACYTHALLSSFFAQLYCLDPIHLKYI